MRNAVMYGHVLLLTLILASNNAQALFNLGPDERVNAAQSAIVNSYHLKNPQFLTCREAFFQHVTCLVRYEEDICMNYLADDGLEKKYCETYACTETYRYQFDEQRTSQHESYGCNLRGPKEE